MAVSRKYIDGKGRWIDDYPEISMDPVPTDIILSEEQFQKTIDKVFKRSWLHVGRIERIPTDGSYFVVDIKAAKASIVIIRKPDGGIGAYHNVCTHRGNQLVWNKSGCQKYLTCKFHGWVFNPNGNLVDITDIEDFYAIDKSKLSLIPVRVDTWEGFIFINLDSSGTESLEDYLGEAGRRLKGYPFDKMRSRSMWRTDVNSNWRLMLDAQSEAYHVPYLHANASQGVFTSSENPHCRLLHFEGLGRHTVSTVPLDTSAVSKNVEKDAVEYGPSPVKTTTEEKYELPSTINPTGVTNWSQEGYNFFPNFNILIWRDMYVTHQFWPVTPSTSVWEFSVNQEPPRTAAERFTQEHATCNFREGMTEDGSTHERTQTALESGVLKHIQLKDDEIGVRYGYHMLEKALAD